MKKLLSFFAALSFICVAHADEGEFDFNRWYEILHQIQARAVSENISGHVINAVIQDGAFVPDVVRRDKNQAEFKLVWDDYIKRAVSAERIRDGRKMRATYPSLLARVDREFGVPPHVILAFWGMESRYGTFKSTHKITDAFLTLIYDGRREKFFTDQLFALMKIADKNNLDIENITGSWAGAMGHFQFIPTTLQQYGMDGNNDGRIDIINNISDAMFSAGNYLNKLGWDKDERILRVVTMPAGFDMSLCDGKTKKDLVAWAALGIKNPDGTKLPNTTMTAGIVCDVENAPTRAYLTYPNFYRIKRWNNSNVYAIAIALLADELKK